MHQLLTLKPPKSLPNSEQPQRSDPRLLEIHAGILLGSDALESGIHEHRERGAAWNGAKLRPFWDGFGVGFFTEMGNGVSVHYLSFLFKPIDGKFIVDGINEKGAVPHIDIF